MKAVVPICLQYHLPLPARFICAARRYWFGIFPQVRRETRGWRLRAQQIPDPDLRIVALQMQHAKIGNVEGAAAYGAFARKAHRGRVVAAQVAFQTAYDYADVLSEIGSEDPVANGHCLHRALLLVAEAAEPHLDYYAHCGSLDDAGYLQRLGETCQTRFGAMPARAAFTAPIERAVSRIVAYQGRNHRHPQGMHLALAAWAREQTPADTGLRWWETAASAGSSTGIFSFIAAASHPEMDERRSNELEGAYFPWAGSLHTLLDSLVDRGEDAGKGQRSLLDYYRGEEEAKSRMRLIASEATHRLRRLPNGESEMMIFAAMASLYVTSLRSDSPSDRAISGAVLAGIGAPVLPALLVFALRGAYRRARRMLAVADLTPDAERGPGQASHSSESCSCRGEGSSRASLLFGRPRLAQWPITWWLRQL
jgi:tetraprenyl-beta-curcumene synthase